MQQTASYNHSQLSSSQAVTPVSLPDLPSAFSEPGKGTSQPGCLTEAGKSVTGKLERKNVISRKKN